MAFRKYKVNDEYFNNWSYEMAYILGFIIADGSVNSYTLSIELQARDIEILKFIKKSLDSSAPIKTTIKNGRSYERLRINSKKLILSLVKYGVVQNKGSKLKLDYKIPKKFLNSYLRGLFDGDGYVCLRRNGIEMGITSASYEFLLKLRNLFNNRGSILPNRKNGRISCFTWQMSKNNSLALRDLMYSNNDFALQRKKDKFFSYQYVPSPRYWTKFQLTYLKKNFVSGKCKDIAIKINKSYKAVYKKVWELGLAHSV